jgi:lipopolysaccharide/colanic/teichoic acid biosynthesis glycosyltransferase
MCKAAVVACFSYYPDIFLEGLRTPRKESSHVSLSSNRYLNAGHSTTKKAYNIFYRHIEFPVAIIIIIIIIVINIIIIIVTTTTSIISTLYNTLV